MKTEQDEETINTQLARMYVLNVRDTNSDYNDLPTSELLQSMEEELIIKAAFREDLTYDQFMDLTRNESGYVLHALGMGNRNPDWLREFYFNTFPVIECEILLNPSAPVDVLEHGVSTGNIEHLGAVARNLNVPSELVDVLLDVKNAFVYEGLIENPNLSPEQLKKLWEADYKNFVLNTDKTSFELASFIQSAVLKHEKVPAWIVLNAYWSSNIKTAFTNIFDYKYKFAEEPEKYKTFVYRAVEELTPDIEVNELPFYWVEEYMKAHITADTV